MAKEVSKTKQPWVSGPKEILQHGLSLLLDDSDKNRRLALLTIDNAVELMIKTFLGLPKRATGLTISRIKYAEFSESFPKLLSALEEYAADRISGINLADIEWYHRLRNQLYHQGNGLTVEREKVEVYAELARLLFKNLFGEDLEVDPSFSNALLGDFITAWSDLEKYVTSLDKKMPSTLPSSAFGKLAQRGILDRRTVETLKQMQTIRNRVVHGQQPAGEVIDRNLINTVRGIVSTIKVRSGQLSLVP